MSLGGILENKRLKRDIAGNKSSISDVINKTKHKFSDFLTKKKNHQITSQQVNLDKMDSIQELSLLKLKISMKEYKTRDLDQNRVFRALYNVEFTVKLGVDLKKLRYKLENGNILHIFNVDVTKIGFEKFSGNPEVEFSEIRYRKTKILGIGHKGWEVFDGDVETINYEKDDIKNIITNINSDEFIKKNTTTAGYRSHTI